MPRWTAALFVALYCLTTHQSSHAADPPQAEREANWPQWRGPWGTGVAPTATPPLEWNESDGEHIRWKTAIPGLGHSSPVVWGNRIFLTTAEPVGEALKPRYSTARGAHDNLPVTHRHKFIALAIDRTTGKIVWQRTLHEALPHDGHHFTGSLASNSPVTDGERVYFHFGSYGLYCLNFDGEELWHMDLGKMQTLHGHGEGSSPALFAETLVVNWDHEEKSFVVAVDKHTGRERWRKARDEITSWSSPIIIEYRGVPQVIISATQRIRSYDLSDGHVIWECGGLSTNVVASPVYAEGMVFTGSSYDTRALLAIQLDGAAGDLTKSRRIAWSKSRATPYVPSPLLYGDSLYYLNHYQGVLTRVQAKTGEDAPGAFRLPGINEIYGSPVGAGGRVYITDRTGVTVVVSHTDRPRVIAENRLDDVISASAALAGRDFILRGQHSLYCLSE
ncbi:MAG: PQQ-binding-like beta-propeller repeat protein [Planctomycetes bacterium]|nr:PQQ-binding-like beta-propeller repeat protein [Planctomycetota bacterium]